MDLQLLIMDEYQNMTDSDYENEEKFHNFNCNLDPQLQSKLQLFIDDLKCSAQKCINGNDDEIRVKFLNDIVNTMSAVQINDIGSAFVTFTTSVPYKVIDNEGEEIFECFPNGSIETSQNNYHITYDINEIKMSNYIEELSKNLISKVTFECGMNKYTYVSCKKCNELFLSYPYPELLLNPDPNLCDKCNS